MSKTPQNQTHFYKITNGKELVRAAPKMNQLYLLGDDLYGRCEDPIMPGYVCKSLTSIAEIHPVKPKDPNLIDDLSKLPETKPEEFLPARGWMVKDIIDEEFTWLDPIARWQNPKVEIECILPGLARTAVGSLVSPGGTGKSMLILQTCVDLALGNPSCLNPKAQARKVAYISVEDQADMVGNRLKDALEQFEFTPKNQTLVRENLRCTGTNNLLIGVKGEVYPELVIERIGNFKPDLLVLDTVSRLHRLDENSSGDMAMLLGAFEDIGRELDCAVLILHHTSKGAMYAKAQGTDVGSAASRGSSVLVDNARSVWSMNTMSKKEAEEADIDPDTRREFVQLTQDKCNIDRWMDAQWFKRAENGLLQEFDLVDAVQQDATASSNKTRRDGLFS